ncbi:MAG: LAGLIDADG family homing endonuclease [Candidatus Micrarchaeota archaeon]
MKLDKELVYLAGVWAGDGCFYKTGNSLRVEFTDGTSVEKEIKYSYEFLDEIRKIIKRHFNKDTKIFRRNNRLIIQFRDKKFFDFLLYVGFKPGEKSKTVDISNKIKGSELEKHFWMGVLDTDGMIGRNTKKITLTSISEKLCKNFSIFLDKNKIRNKIFEFTSKTGYTNPSKAYVVQIDSPFIRIFSEVMTFNHPRKRRWLLNHLKKEFYVQNESIINDFLLDGNIIDYARIFDNKIYVVNGYDLAKRFNIDLIKRWTTKNAPFVELFEAAHEKGVSKTKFYFELSKYRIKMSKGSTNSVLIPLKTNSKIENLCKMVRLTCGGIKIPREFAKTSGCNTDILINNAKDIFDLNPKTTSAGEIIFCSGVLNQIFSKFIKRKNVNYDERYWLNKWSNAI